MGSVRHDPVGLEQLLDPSRHRLRAKKFRVLLDDRLEPSNRPDVWLRHHPQLSDYFLKPNKRRRNYRAHKDSIALRDGSKILDRPDVNHSLRFDNEYFLQFTSVSEVPAVPNA